MFYGEFQHKVDDKGRVPIPPRMRRELKDGVALVPGVERCINAYTIAEWQKTASTMATTGPITREKMRRLNRYIFATAFRLQLDAQGRIALPVTLREYAGIGNDVVIAGVNNYLEIWNKEVWEEEKTLSQEQAWQIIESLERQ